MTRSFDDPSFDALGGGGGTYDYGAPEPLDPGGGIDPGVGGGGLGGGGTGGTGGGTGGTGGTGGAPTATTLAEMDLDEGNTLVVAYGQHLVAGNLVQYNHAVGPPPATKFITALGEGPWDSIVKAWYAGEEISASPDGTTAGYHFHPGTASTGIADPNQGEDSFWTSPPTYSQSAYASVLLSAAQSVEERPDKFRAVCKCLLVADYDNAGNETDAGSYSANPARVAADLLKRAGLLSTIDWVSWVAWRDYCDVLITWGGASIKRFECHLALLQPTDLPTALSYVCQTSCNFWQDTGFKIAFTTPLDANNTQPGDALHTFTEANCRGVTVIGNDWRALPTGYIARFRDIDDEYMGEVTVEVTNAQLETLSGGQTLVEIGLPPMNRSQAERICNWLLKLNGEAYADIELIGFGDSYALLPGDFVAINHEVIEDPLNPTPYYGIVTEAEDLPEESGPGLRRFRIKICTQLYDDTAHTVPVT